MGKADDDVELIPKVDAADDEKRIRKAFWAFATRRVNPDCATRLLRGPATPAAGDLVLARVDFLGQHPGLQLPCGRRRQLFPGDEIVVAYGNRYASNQFESVVPETIGPCHLAAGGGIASRVISWHVKMSKGPTLLTPVGLLCTADGRRVNLANHALEPVPRIDSRVPTAIAVVGTGMDSGKTQSCVYLVRGLLAAGLRVGYAKVTGTGAGGDTWAVTDAGASPVLDFTDAGMATTYLATPEAVEQALVTLVHHIGNAGVDAIVLEIADGVLQRETSALLRSPVTASLVGGFVMASQDSMGASAGVHWLQQNAKPPVLALSGIISASPLQSREAVTALGLPVHDRQGLATPDHAMQILGAAQRYLEQTRRQRKQKGHHNGAPRNIQSFGVSGVHLVAASGAAGSQGASQRPVA